VVAFVPAAKRLIVHLLARRHLDVAHSDASNAAISRTPMASTPSATSRGNGGLTAQAN
jgi:hypothetical protein